jgi:hypothetical protein
MGNLLEDPEVKRCFPSKLKVMPIAMAVRKPPTQLTLSLISENL